MPRCFLETCGNYYEKTKYGRNIIYHMLPCDKTALSKWLKVCGISKDHVPYYARICSEHFSDDCYQRDMQHELLGLPLRRKLRVDAIPDQNLPNLAETEGAKTIKKPEEAAEEVEYKVVRRKRLSLLRRDVNQIEHNYIKRKRDSKQMPIKESICGKTIKISPDILSEIKKQTDNQRNLLKEEAKKDKNKGIVNSIFDSVDNRTLSKNKSLLKPIVAKRVKKQTPPKEGIIILPETEFIAQNSVNCKKIFDFKKSMNNEILKQKEDKGKINNKLNKLPMRSSYRIAKKKSIELLSDSFTEKVNQPSNRPAKFSDKLKFMAKLQLKFERKENVGIPIKESEKSLDEQLDR